MHRILASVGRSTMDEKQRSLVSTAETTKKYTLVSGMIY